MPKKEKKGKVFKAEYYDFNLVAVVILLICFGLVMLYNYQRLYGVGER